LHKAVDEILHGRHISDTDIEDLRLGIRENRGGNAHTNEADILPFQKEKKG
jgi:hypothetical protein